jgi:poly-gamma-glutamate synthesis protein (capsule biosynthesis protein)
MPSREKTVLLVGDLILDQPNPDFFFARSRAVLLGADVVVGNVEVPHTTRGWQSTTDVPAPPSDPDHLRALGRAGFHVATMAGNHCYDAGPFGIEDTVAALRAQGIATTGAGANLLQARQPAKLERDGVRFGFLSYNCVGPRESWASAGKAGCAYVRVLTHYELDLACPGGPPTIYTFAEPLTLEAMQADIAQLRGHVDVLTVALHKGIGHTPAVLAMYERPLAKAAIEAGADLVVGHHAHILRGIEVYKGRPIFHGLGNFVAVTRALDVEQNASPERLAWARRRRELFGFDVDPDYSCYPFHPEAKNAIIAFGIVGADGMHSAGFLPCWVNPQGAPEVLGNDARGQAVCDYVLDITRRAGLKTEFRWDGDRVMVVGG